MSASSGPFVSRLAKLYETFLECLLTSEIPSEANISGLVIFDLGRLKKKKV